MAAQILVVFEIPRFLGFPQNFSENVDIKSFTKLEITIYVVRLYQGTPRSLPPNMTAQNLAVFQI